MHSQSIPYYVKCQHVLALHISSIRSQRVPYSSLKFPPGWWDHLALNGFVCLLIPFAGSSKNKQPKRCPLMQEPVAILSAASLGSGSAKRLENSLGLPGQFGVSRGLDSLDNLQSSITIYGSLSKPNSESSHSPISNWNTSQNKVCCQVLWGRARQQGEGTGSAGDGLLKPGLGGQGRCNHPSMKTWANSGQQKETEHKGGSF